MTLRLHNTLTKQTEPFTPQDSTRVKLYTCGPTVYGYAHVGNWAGYIYWDILIRTLRANGYEPERVMNITDVGHLTSDEDEGEDKLQKGARREGKTAWEVATLYSNDFLANMKRLNIIEPEHITKATEFIPEQLELVRTLKKKGYTYQIDDGIYYDTSKFPTYADFAELDLAGQKAGARVSVNTQKRNPSDFALWKFSPTDEQRDMEWETPEDLLDTIPRNRKGFPGWHLECSAMALSILGPTLDIHTGGIDHIPVHHTDEIAQSEAATGVRFSNYWLHNNHLKVNGTKISKSLGNGYTIQDLEDRGYAPQDLRMFVLQGHYRSEGNFTFENLTAAQNRLHNWRAVAVLRHQTHDTLRHTGGKQVHILAALQAIVEALNDDLNTPRALSLIDETFTTLESTPLDAISREELVQLLEHIDTILGIELLETTPDISDEMKQLIIARERARDDKDWQRSDELRAVLKEQGILVRDTSSATVWSYLAT